MYVTSKDNIYFKKLDENVEKSGYDISECILLLRKNSNTDRLQYTIKTNVATRAI